MNSKLLSKILLINLFVIILLVTLGLVFIPYPTLLADVQSGDILVESYPLLAETAYKHAEQKFPPIKINYSYQRKIALMKFKQEEYKKNKPAMILFLKDDIALSDQNLLISELKTNQSITNVKYVSKKDAMNAYKERNKGNKVLLELITENILPASIEVYSDNFPIDYSIIQKYKVYKGVDTILDTGSLK